MYMSLEEIRYWKDYYKYKLSKVDSSGINTWKWGYLACKERFEYFKKKEKEFIIANMNLKKVRRHSRTD